jgi:hypothetical protein
MGQYWVLPQDNTPSSIEGFSGAAARMPHCQRQPSVVPMAKLRLHLFASAAPGPYCPNGTWWIKESNPTTVIWPKPPTPPWCADQVDLNPRPTLLGLTQA